MPKFMMDDFYHPLKIYFKFIYLFCHDHPVFLCNNCSTVEQNNTHVPENFSHMI